MTNRSANQHATWEEKCGDNYPERRSQECETCSNLVKGWAVKMCVYVRTRAHERTVKYRGTMPSFLLKMNTSQQVITTHTQGILPLKKKLILIFNQTYLRVEGNVFWRTHVSYIGTDC